MQQRLQGPGWDGESGAAVSPKVSRAVRLVSDDQANSAGELTAKHQRTSTSTSTSTSAKTVSAMPGDACFCPGCGTFWLLRGGNARREEDQLAAGREMKGWRERRGLKCEIFKTGGKRRRDASEIPSSPSVCTPSASL